LEALRRTGGTIARAGGATQRFGRSGTDGKKNAEYQIEKELEATRIVERLTGEHHPDMEAWETAVLEAALKAGAHVLAMALRGIGCGRRDKPVLCACGERMRSVGLRTKGLTSLLGALPIERSLYICPVCEDASCFPADRLLGIEHTSFSPGVRRLMARAGSRTPFGEAHDDLKVYAHVDVGARDIERIAEQVGQEIAIWRAREDHALLKGTRMPVGAPRIPILYVSFDGTCIPMRKAELHGRRGKQPDGKAKGREVKLGCVFTQTKLDDQGHPLRDPESTTYVGAIESSGPFGERMYAEALRRGLLQAATVVVLTDGAKYNKSIAQLHFSNAIHIIDLYHAREHLDELIKLLAPSARTPKRQARWHTLLDHGEIAKLAAEAQRHLPTSAAQKKLAAREIAFFRSNALQMRYAEFRQQGFFVGSGVIEAGCRTVIGSRLKQSGMFWSLSGANAIIESRCCQMSRRFEDFWESVA
jgi:hypothetical protein